MNYDEYAHAKKYYIRKVRGNMFYNATVLRHEVSEDALEGDLILIDYTPTKLGDLLKLKPYMKTYVGNVIDWFDQDTKKRVSNRMAYKLFDVYVFERNCRKKS